MLGFNWVDFILIVLLAVGMALGYAQGLIRQVFGLVAFYLGVVLAAQFFQSFSTIFRDMFHTRNNLFLTAIAFFVTMLAVMVPLNILALDAYRVTRLRVLPVVDYLAGMALGLISMWFLLTVIVTVLYFATSAQTWVQAEWLRQTLRAGIAGSQLARYAASTVPVLITFLRPWLPFGLPAMFSQSF